MTVLNAHFIGKRLVLDDPVPDGIPDNTMVRVLVPSERRSKALEAIASLAISIPDLPRDYAKNHDKYLYGEP